MRPVDVVNVDLCDQAAKPELLKAEAFDFFSPMFFSTHPVELLTLWQTLEDSLPAVSQPILMTTDYDEKLK